MRFLSFLLLFFTLFACKNEQSPQENETPAPEQQQQQPGQTTEDKALALEPIDPIALQGVRTRWSWIGTGISGVRSVKSVPGLKAEILPEGDLLFTIVGDIGSLNVVQLETPEGRVDLLLREAGNIPAAFRLKDKGYKEVRVVGDMNNWDASRGLMVKKGKVWELIFPLPPGSYRYRFVVDGKPMPDPINPNKGKDDQGQPVSVYQIKPKGGSKQALPEVELVEVDGPVVHLHLPKGGIAIALLNNRQMPVKMQDEEAFVQLPPNARGTLRVYVQNEAGLGGPLVVPVP